MRYSNPILSGMYPDPSICRVGEDYYLVTSSFEYFPGVPLFHSKDLVHWEQIGHCLSRPSQLDLTKTSPSDGVWAPTIRYHDGRFYMITTNNTNSAGNFYVYTDDILGEWSEPIFVDFGGIDPSLFFDDNGKVYYTGMGFDDGYGIYLFEIDLTTGEKLTKPRKIWSGTGAPFAEAPHLYKINGYYYLLLAEGGTEYEHMASIARTKDLADAFEPCPHNPVLSNRSKPYPIKAVGHADIVEAHDGSWWGVCLGVRPMSYPQKHNLGRETFLFPVVWDQNGWPVMGINGSIDLEMEADGLPPVVYTAPTARDDFDSDTLQYQWNFLRNPYPEDWSLTERPGFLALHGSALTLNEMDSPAFVGRRLQHHKFVVRTKLEFEPSENEEAGLVVEISSDHHYEIALSRIEGKKVLLFRRRIGTLWKVESTVEYTPSSVIFELKSDQENYIFSYGTVEQSLCELGRGECKYITTEVGGAFTGSYVGMYATGNGKQSKACAYFDWFEYQKAEEKVD